MKAGYDARERARKEKEREREEREAEERREEEERDRDLAGWAVKMRKEFMWYKVHCPGPKFQTEQRTRTASRKRYPNQIRRYMFVP